MRAMREPVERTLDQLRLFLGMPELKLMHVRTSPHLLPALVGAVGACEQKENNRSPMMMLLAPASRAGGGWDGREAELRREFDDLRDAAQKAGLAIPALPARTDRDASGAFAVALSSASKSLPEPLSGLIVLLVPGTGCAAINSELATLWAHPALSAVRWIVLESAAELLGPASGLGERALLVDARPSDESMLAELQQRAQNGGAAPAGATGDTATGCAVQGVLPPRRPHEAPAPSPELERDIVAKHGSGHVHVDAVLARQLRIAVLEATAAAAGRDFARAVEQFRIARDLCLGANLTREALSYELTMAAVALSGAPAAAVEAFAIARERARASGEVAFAARAEMGRAGALLATRRFVDALEAYRIAGDMAAESEPVMAIEAYRMCGQLLVSNGYEEQAVKIWRRAMDVAGSNESGAIQGSTAPDVARALAKVCERHGLRAQAVSLREQAAKLGAKPDLESLHPSNTFESVSLEGGE